MSVADRIERVTSWMRRLPPLVGDAALALAVLVAQLAPFVSNAPAAGTSWPPQMYLPVLIATVPVIWRRRAPLVTLLLAEVGIAGYAFFPHGPSQPLWFGALIGMFTLAERAPRWQRIGALVLIGWGAVIVTGSLETAVRGALLWLTAYAMGRAWAARRAQADALAERARHLEQERELAAARERARIARDMHDILGHAVSIMIAQAEAGPVAARSSPEKAEKVFGTIAAAGRDAMGQLRDILGVLSQDDAPVTEQPGLSEVAALVRQAGGAGPRITLTESGRPAALHADAQLAAYRIVQESLTNAIRHAGADTVTVRLDWHDGGLTVTVTDDGRGVPPVPAQRAGNGLIGLRERAVACGGSAEYGPSPGGRGFQVTALLPAERTKVPA